MNRLVGILSTVLAIAMSIAVFQITYMVDDLEDELRQLNSSILEEQKNMQVLQGEWAHLNDPDRLRDLAQRFLQLEPISGEQVVKIDDLPADAAALPAATEAVAAPHPDVKAASLREGGQ